MNASRRPYYSPNDQPVLEQSIVVEADIPGYKFRLERAHKEGREEAELRLLHDAIAEAYREISDAGGAKWRVKTFSDNLMVGYPWLGTGGGAFEFDQACCSIAHFQLSLAVRGIFIRGGIAVGPIHIGDHFVFGRILSEMKKMDETAVNPCVYLAESAMDYMKRNQSCDADNSLANVLWKDSDHVFINYLFPLNCLGDKLRKEMVEKHRDMIMANLQEFHCKSSPHDERVFKKYVWLKDYHNSFCRLSRYWRDPPFLIPDSF